MFVLNGGVRFNGSYNTISTGHGIKVVPAQGGSGSCDTAFQVSKVSFALSTVRITGYSFTPNKEVFYITSTGVIDGQWVIDNDFIQRPALYVYDMSIRMLIHINYRGQTVSYLHNLGNILKYRQVRTKYETVIY